MTTVDAGDEEWEERYRYLVEEAEDMLYLLDDEGRYALVNDSMAEMTGYDKEELIGNTPSMLLSEEDTKKGRHRVSHLLHTDKRKSDTWTVTVITKDGNRIPSELRFTLLPADDGEYNGIVGVARDIRERKRREQKLQVMTRVLRHNIRNKLGLVMGVADLLGERATNEDYDLTTGEIVEATDQIVDTADEMVRLSEKVRTIQERIRSHPEGDYRTDVARLGRAVVQQFRADNPDADLSFDGPDECWAAVSESYEVALSELIENGIVHNDTEDPAVHVQIREEDGTVVTTVVDECEAIPDTEKRVIREERETDLSHSSGVGLWLVYWVVRAASGDIEFEHDGDGNHVELRFEATDPG